MLRSNRVALLILYLLFGASSQVFAQTYNFETRPARGFMPIQNGGSACPATDAVEVTVSSSEPGRAAEMMPAGIAIRRATAIAAVLSSTVAGIRSRISERVGLR